MTDSDTAAHIDADAPASGDHSADTHSAPAPSADNAGAEGGDGQRKRRRRRRRRGRGGSGGDDAAHQQDGQQDGQHDGQDDGDGEDAPDAQEPAPSKPKRQPPEIHPEAHKEVFSELTFGALGLRNSVLKGVEASGFVNPTKIQAELIPLVLQHKDVLGQAKTGSGKTAAFGLPLFHLATRDLPFQSLVLVPTRELAIQVAGELAELGKFTPIRVSAVFGGESVRTQSKNLERGPEIIVATPGRLMDMVERGHLSLENVRFAVLDEVDRMLDIGFRDDIRKILGMIKSEHRTIFVSATISDEIEKLARRYMRDPAKIVSHSGSLTVNLVEQHYLPVQPWDKRRLLTHLLTHEEPALTIVFCRTKRTVDDVAEHLQRNGIDVQAIHGDMHQGKRNRVMKHLHAGSLSVLVASDLAARGLDVENITHVINYDMPEDPEVYIHRIGRTARAGRGGVAWSFVTSEQGDLLTAVEMLANIEIPKMEYPDFEPSPPREGGGERRGGGGGGRGGRDSRGGRGGDRGGRGGDRGGDRGQSRGDGQPPAEQKPAQPKPSRSVPPPPPPATKADASRFPGGLVPTKLPPKRLMGRVKTSRSNRGVVPPPTTED